MTKQYCAWANEMVDPEEHESCICKECDFCGEPLKRKYSIEGYSSNYLHKKCVMDWLVYNGELIECGKE